MAAHDSSWEIFRAELKRWMDLRRLTNKALAEAVNEDLHSCGLTNPVDEQIIKRWRHSTAPPLKALKVIARTLRMSDDATGVAPYDPTYLPRTMGVLDEAPENAELIEAAYRLQTVRAKLTETQNALAAVTADEGVLNIVRTAADAGLAVAITPALEGPRGYPMHVSDRLDFRVPQFDQPAPDVNDYPLLADALQDTFATISRRSSRFSRDAATDPSIAKWAVQYIGRPRTGVTHRPHTGLPAVALTAVSTTAWPDDIADIVAMVLGYGLTTTRELARELVNYPDAADRLRTDIHDSFLYSATPHRRVWTHHGGTLPPTNAQAPFRDAVGRVSNQLLSVFLVEDDAGLRQGAASPAGSTRKPTPEEVEQTFERYRQTRDAIVERAAMAGGDRVVTIPVTYQQTAEENWAQVFEVALQILRVIEGLGVEADLGELHERLARTDPQVMPQVLRWMADHAAPYVDARYRTR